MFPRVVYPALVVVLGLVLVGPAGAVPSTAPLQLTVSVTTDNVEHVAYLPELGPSVSARVVEVDDQKRLYVSSIKGLSIYDVTDPPNPQLMGVFHLPNWQNEDIAVSEDGNVAILAVEDANLHNFIFDTSNPLLPRLASRITPGDHTVECVDPACDYAYGRGGRTFDLRNIDAPVILNQGWRQRAQQQGYTLSQPAHALVRDATGLISTDTIPRLVLDPRPHTEDGVAYGPENPRVLAHGPLTPLQGHFLAYQHNNLRPRAEDWQPRTAENADDPGLLPGELLLTSGETNLTVTCNGTSNGPFATWTMRDFDEGENMEPLHMFRPLRNSNYLDGDPAVNVLGCSSHWFDWQMDEDGDYIVPVAWFEHGVRFLHVTAATGEIRELGFFQPFNGSVGATYWIDDEYVYTTDYVRGIDILRWNPLEEPVPQEELDANWEMNLQLARSPMPETVSEQYVCRLAATGAQ